MFGSSATFFKRDKAYVNKATKPSRIKNNSKIEIACIVIQAEMSKKGLAIA